MKSKATTIFGFFIKGIISVVVILLTYCFIIFILSRIPVSAQKTDDLAAVPIYIRTNGVHTDIILPTKNAIMDWTVSLPPSNTTANQAFDYTAFGWGDRDFYLNTPQWSDLKVSTACKACLYLGNSVMHTQFCGTPEENDRCVKILLTESQYAQLCQYVLNGFENRQPVVIKGACYNQHDSFYRGSGRYSACYTCNSWANEALKSAGQKAAVWTLSDTGIFCHYR